MTESETARQMDFMSRPGVGFTAKRFHLYQLVERAAAVVPGKTGINDLLSNFQIMIGDGMLRLAATDMELSLLTESSLVTCRGTGTVLMPARMFLQILREADEGDVTVDIERGSAHITAGRYEGDLLLQPADDYPPLPDPAQITFVQVNRQAFLRAIALVKNAASRDGTNPRLMAISIAGGKVTAASHVRLHQTPLPDFPLDIQVPIGAVDDLGRLLEDSELEEIGIGEAQYVLAFRIGHDVFMTGKLHGEYPDMEKRLLRTPMLENHSRLVVNRGDLIAAIRRVRITADQTSAAIGLRLQPGTLTVISRDQVGNAAREELPAEWAEKERTIILNHVFLTELISLTGEPAVVFMLGRDTGKKRSPLLLRDDKSGAAGVIGQLAAELPGS